MKSIKSFGLIMLSLMLFSACAEAQTKRKKTTNTPQSKLAKPANVKPMPTNNNGYKVLVEGAYSKVETPFVLVARDPETFALIRTLVEDLPASSTIDFNKSAVIAAFAGEKNSGGYSVSIRPVSSRIIVDVQSPPKGAMTTQAITSPFKVVAVPAAEMQALPLELTPTWTSQMKIYRVSSADFEYSGGIDGRMKKFAADGTIGVLSYGDLITYNFNLSGKGNDQKLKLLEVSSGALKSGNVQFARLDAGTFAEFPRPALKVFGTANDAKLSLMFESLPSMVSDGFMARGKLEAAKVK